MASADTIRMGKGEVEIGANLDPLRKALNNAKKEFEAWGKTLVGVGAGFAAIGASITAAFAYGLHSFAEAADHIVIKSRITGIALQDLQTLSFGLRVDLDELGKASKGLDKFITHAAEGAPAATERLAQLGLSLEQLAKMSQADRIRAVGAAIQRTFTDVSQRHGVQVEIFGKQGLGLDFNNLARREQRLGQLGGVISDADLEIAKDYNRAVLELGVATSGVWNRIGAVVAPIFARFYDGITGVLIYIQQFIDNNRELMEWIFKLGSAFVGIGTTLAFIGGGFILFGKAMGLISTAIGVLLTPVKLLSTLFSVVTAVMGLVFSPAGLIVIGIGLVAAGIYYIATHLEEMGEAATAVYDAVAEAFTAVVDTFAMLFKDVIAKLKEYANAAIGVVQNIWDKIKGMFSSLGSLLPGWLFGGEGQSTAPAAPGSLAPTGDDEKNQTLQEIQAATQAAQAAAAETQGFFAETASVTMSIWSGAWNSITGIFTGALDGIRDYFNTMISSWTEIFNNFASTVAETWGGVVDAISAGNLQLAFEIAVTGMELVWARVVNWLRSSWFSFTYIFQNAWGSVTTSIAHAFVNLSSFLTEAFFKLSETIEDVFNAVVSFIARSINVMINTLPDFVKEQFGLEELTDPNNEATRAARDAERERAAAQRRRDVQSTNSNLDADEARAERERSAGLINERSRASNEEAEIQARLSGLVGQARREAEIAERNRQILRERAGGGDPSLLTSQAHVMGSFAAAAISGQGVSGSPAERTARAAEEIRRLQEETNYILTEIADQERDKPDGFEWD